MNWTFRILWKNLKNKIDLRTNFLKFFFLWLLFEVLGFFSPSMYYILSSCLQSVTGNSRSTDWKILVFPNFQTVIKSPDFLARFKVFYVLSKTQVEARF